MLPLPNLDDLTFIELVENAKKLISRFAPDWTDYNLHDPGISIIELLAWLVEMQQYHQNRIPDQNYLKFLKLLGTRPHDAVSAQTWVTFYVNPSSDPSLNKSKLLPKNTKLLSGEGIAFETDRDLRVTGAEIEKVITSSLKGYIDNSQANNHDGIYYYPFGNDDNPGSTFYLGLINCDARLDSGFSMFVKLLDDEGFQDKSSQIYPSVSLIWEYRDLDVGSDRDAWIAFEKLHDGTYGFYRTGVIDFPPPGRLEQFELDNIKGSRFWIRCRIDSGAFENRPQVDTIMLDTIPASQCETLVETHTMVGVFRKDQIFVSLPAPLMHSSLMLQSYLGPGLWRDEDLNKIKRAVFKRCQNMAIKSAPVKKPQPDSARIIRIVTGESGMPGFSSDGQPGQVYSLNKGSVLKESFMLQVKESNGWADWKMVDDFLASGPLDRHFVLKPDSGEIAFGDGEKGRIPPLGTNVVQVISCQAGGGVTGNVGKKSINTIARAHVDFSNLKVSNGEPAAGGLDPENLEDAQARVRRELKNATRGVTIDDFIDLALHTPGIKVARAHAAPGPVSGTGDKTGNSVIVTVVPFSSAPQPVPGAGFLKTVGCYLNKHRLITTEVRVIAPQYIEVSVEALVTFKEGYMPDALLVENRLKEFLSPLGNGKDYAGWPFGRAVYMSEIYEQIEKILGVDYVEDVGILFEKSDQVEFDGENLKIPANYLVCSKAHYIDVQGPRNPGSACQDVDLSCPKGGEEY